MNAQRDNASALISPRFVLATGVLGVLCGLAGAAFTVILAYFEQVAFGSTTGTAAEAVTQAPAERRFWAVAIAGLVIAALWWALRRLGPHVPSVSQAAGGASMPIGWTLADTTLQVINVGVGGSIGREGAPRQSGAMCADRFSHLLALSVEQRRILVACGAGAGLASIYNVPLGGALFALECVWGFSRLRSSPLSQALIAAIAALASSFLATAVAWIIVPDRPTYPTPPIPMEVSLIGFALVCGPLLGIAGYAFGRFFDILARRAPRDITILWKMPLSYLVLACLAVPLPLVLGNGHALALEVFASSLPLETALLLLAAKPLATFLTVGCGAVGGKLTPSLSTGAAFGMVLAVAWSTFWPISTIGPAILGAAAMLAAASQAPLTAVVLLIEFTALDPRFWWLVALATFGGFATAQILDRMIGKNAEKTEK